LSLPRIFRTGLSTIPAETPYVHIDAKLVENWREKLLAMSARDDCNSGSPFRVGIAWQGDANFLWDRWRSIPLTSFDRLARIPGVQLISLQAVDGREQLSALGDRFPLIDLGEQLDQQAGAFMDTAAIMKNLDLVIASDSAVAHLAGALGAPVWVPLSHSPDWRWLLGRDDCPWYPTMRLFRQTTLGDWEGVFERIAAALKERITSLAAAEAVGRLLRSAVDDMQNGRAQNAGRGCDEILAIDPNQPDALNLQGVLAHQAGRPAESAQFLHRAIHGRPADATFHYNLGVAEHVQGKLDAAISSYQETLRLQPNHADACNNLGFALAEKNRTDEALAYYERALQLRPDYAEAHSNTGLALAAIGKLEEALHHCDRALRIAPNNADARLVLAVLLLLKGDYERGWEEYEWRWKSGPMASRGIGPGVPSLSPPPYTQPLWDGAPLDGRTILLYAEQGLGDTLQFIRYAPLVQERGGTVIVECQSRLERLLGRSPGIDSLIPTGSPLPPFDFRAPLLSLPRILKTTLTMVPAEVPYVFPAPRLVDSWKKVLGALSGYKVGIAWSADRRFDWGGRRRVALQQFAPLARIPGVRLISLQKGQAADEVGGLSGEFAITDFAAALDEAAGPFMDTAAIMKSLDLVISVDTSVAHLAGAVGVPVWIVLPFVPDWRWLMGRDDSPWYPTARLFRQSRPGEWDDVFRRIAVELGRVVGRAPSP
jgi:tetratricopeptide (TPR) repeat protein